MTANVVHPAELERMLQTRVEAARTKPLAVHGRSRSRRRFRRSSAALLAGTLLALIAATVYGVITVQSVEVTGRTGYAKDLTDEGAIVEYIGDLNQSFGSSGSGIFDSFVRVQENDDEKGYNTDGDLEFNTKAGAFTRSILVSEIPTIPCSSLDGGLTSGGLCFELFADLNESDSTKLITLDALEIYFTTEGTAVTDDGDGPDLTGYPFSGNTTKVYDSDDQVRINDVNQGSGRGDLRYLVPVTGITIPSNCSYGSTTCTTYFVLYSEYGFADGLYDSDGGFEEWKVKRYPFLSVSKTATTTFTRTFPWTIDKSVTPASWALFDGETGTSRYTIAVTKQTGVDSNWAVSGTITVSNPSDQTAVIASVTDVVSGADAGSATVSCGVTFPHSLAKGNSLECTYSRSLPDGTSRTNTATATLTTGPAFSGTEAVTFGAPTTLVNNTIHVTDNNLALPGEPVAFSASGSVNVDKAFNCDSLTLADGGSDSYTFNNTATITQTGQTDGASVSVTCYRLDVDKTANESRTRTWNWTIDKAVTPASWSLFDGETGTSRYTITVDKVNFTDSAWAVSGTITITNPHPTRAATINSVTDVISALGLTDVNATVADCGGDTAAPYTVPAASNVVCNYSATLGSGVNRTNTATATQQLYTFNHLLAATAAGTEAYSDTEAVDFTNATTTEVNPTISVTDNNLALPGEPVVFSDDGSVSVDKAFNCDSLTLADGGSDSYTFNNTATITQTGQTDGASVSVTCYRLDVEKTANEAFTRTWTWTINKSADQTTLTLMVDQTFVVNYTVVVNATSIDSAWAVSGTITITNPHPTRAATINSVTDVISALGLTDVNATVADCGGDTTAPYTVPIAGNVVCNYSATLGSGVNRTNTATATQQLYTFDHLLAATADGTEAYSDTEAVAFGGPTSIVDECVNVTDTNLVSLSNPTGALGTACAPADIPKTFTYPLTLGPYGVEACGTFNVDNMAVFMANDTGASGNDTHRVVITIPCPQGCTLTLGYWKTHNVTFPGGAPPDPNWSLIGDFDGDGTAEKEGEAFFGTGQTWYQAFWTSVSGRPYYQLAHQWMAAYLNWKSIVDLGGTIPGNVMTAITQGQAFLDANDVNRDLKGKAAKDLRATATTLAGILGSFNEGLIGPGHCDEDNTSTLTGATTQLIADRRTAFSIG